MSRSVFALITQSFGLGESSQHKNKLHITGSRSPAPITLTGNPTSPTSLERSGSTTTGVGYNRTKPPEASSLSEPATLRRTRSAAHSASSAAKCHVYPLQQSSRRLTQISANMEVCCTSNESSSRQHQQPSGDDRDASRPASVYSSHKDSHKDSVLH
ncbi:uncharacterized protein V6R79_024571 [Siganus canaliculatus]